MRSICVVAPCYNEEKNVRAFYHRIVETFDTLKGQYRFSICFIDNASQDNTAQEIRKLVNEDKRVKAIFNLRNFGHIRSPYYGLLQPNADANILMAVDFQDPPELLPSMLDKWVSGFPVVFGVKNKSREPWFIFKIRNLFYTVINRVSDVRLISNATGFGVYDKKVIETLRTINTPYPYLRGLIPELGFPIGIVTFVQPRRKHGRSSNNFYSLYDMAMTGITHHSKVPLRIAAFAGFIMSFISLLIAFGYFIAKLLWWDKFNLGQAPTLIGIFFFGAVQLLFIGVIGEYIGAIFTQTLQRPLVIERERLGFESEDANYENIRDLKVG